MRTTVDIETLRKARAYARRKFTELREDYRYSGHSSHAASKAIELAGEKFDIGHGCEGVCWNCGREGLSYLNMGDTYDTTILFDSRTEQFRLGSWGDFVERNEHLGIE